MKGTMYMETITHSTAIDIKKIQTAKKKLKDYFIKPLKAGFYGFITILLVLFIINLFSFLFGSTEHFGMDILDILLASVGFILQLTATLFKSFVR